MISFERLSDMVSEMQELIPKSKIPAVSIEAMMLEANEEIERTEKAKRPIAQMGPPGQPGKDGIDIPNIDLELQFKVLTRYKVLTYSGSQLILIDIYSDASHTNKLYTKALAYTGPLLTSIIITRLSDSATLTKTLSYTGSQLTQIACVES